MTQRFLLRAACVRVPAAVPRRRADSATGAVPPTSALRRGGPVRPSPQVVPPVTGDRWRVVV
ncbi:hypothetical protein [Actinosynnema sp. NPDC020468]|uniref:hypothetical protein n=1 Tax=Actinosynnema sp. NPDC020468 TaxID=3154488 RepID=UPI0033F19427